MSQISPVLILLIGVLLILGALRLPGLGRFGAELSQLLQESKRLTVVLLFLGARQLSRFGVFPHELPHLLQELKRHMPVYSAETVEGKEAEFIRDELPKGFPAVLVVIGLLLLGAVAWWLSR
jgi:fumarate reductase subunit D